MKEYNYKEKKRIVKNKKYNAIIPDEHSTISALIFETKDLNAWDDYANITNYHTLCMIQKKGKREWEVLYDGATREFKLNGVHLGCAGIFSVLYQLETQKVRHDLHRKAEIKQLKDRIKKDSRTLKILLTTTKAKR